MDGPHPTDPLTVGESPQTPASVRGVLSRDFSTFLIQLSIALQRFSIYPDGHPSLEPTVRALVARLEMLLLDRPVIAIGVARHQLVIEGVTTAPDNPVLRRLASVLHRHQLSAVTVARGVDGREVTQMLAALAVEPHREGPVGARAGGPPSWAHLALYPVAFDRLTVSEFEDGPGGPPTTGDRSRDLWIGLAQAAMSRGLGGGDGTGQPDQDTDDVVSTTPTEVARAIDGHTRVAAYDQVIVGYLLQIAHEVRAAGGAEVELLRRRTSKLLATLSPETLRSLVEMGGDLSQRAAFVRDVTAGMSVEAVVDVVKAAAEAGQQTISHGLMRMLSKLAVQAEAGPAESAPMADAAIREQASELLQNWALTDPNPENHRRLLEQMATSSSRSEDDDGDVGDQSSAEHLRIIKMGLEVGGAGPVLDRALDAAFLGGDLCAVMDVLESVPAGASDTAAAAVIRERLSEPGTLGAVLATEPLDRMALERLVPYVTADGYEMLLDAMATCEHRATRRLLLELLARSPVDIGPAVVARLGDRRWFVQRNLLVVLRRTGRVPEGFSARRWTLHPDVRVRYEALRLQLVVADDWEATVRLALSDGHERVVQLGLSAASERDATALASLVGPIVLDLDRSDETRALAMAILGRCRGAEVAPVLCQILDGGTTLLGRRRLASKSPLVLAAIAALRDSGVVDPTAVAMLALAKESPDPDIRRVAAGGTP